MAKANRRRGRQIEGVGEVLRREILRGAARRRAIDELVRAKWEEVVGPAIAPRAAPVSFKGHVLRVRVDSSALLAELSGIYKKELVTAMAEGENPVSVRTIEFELAGAAERG